MGFRKIFFFSGLNDLHVHGTLRGYSSRFKAHIHKFVPGTPNLRNLDTEGKGKAKGLHKLPSSLN
jgi:hypothetical protein